MSRALYRGLSTPERIRQLSIEEPGSPTKGRDEQGGEERSRNRPMWESCFPHSMRLWIKQNVSMTSSLHKHGVNSSETGSKSGKFSDSPGGSLSVNSPSGSNSGLLPNCISSLRCYSKPSTFSFLPFVLLCLIGAFALFTIAGLNRPIPAVIFPPHNYRRAQLLAWRDLLRGGILGRGSIISHPREVAACSMGMEDYIPCYNVTASLEAGYADGREFEPHCELANKIQCLLPAPEDYQVLSKWPGSSEGIWRGNVQVDEATAENRFFVEEHLIKFPDKDEKLRNGVESHVQQIAGIVGLSGVKGFIKAKIRNVLDVGCGFGSLGAHLWGHGLLTMCIAPYEEHGGQVQITLERGFPAMIASLTASKLPYPSSSYDLIHCAECGIGGESKDGVYLFEVDRLLRIGGYFVLVIPVQDGLASHRDEVLTKIQNSTSRIGWEMVSPFQPDTMLIWRKRAPHDSMSQNVDWTIFCEEGRVDGDWAWHQPMRPCKTLSPGHRQISVQDQLGWPSRLQLADTESSKPGSEHDESTGEPRTWIGTVADYWSMLTPIIFSDHPKRMGDEDVGPGGNLVRNVMDMNAGHGALNAALLMSGKPVWVMNVIPTSAKNTLPFIFDRGLIGALHEWCEPFPTYPRTYDFLYAADLLSQELTRQYSFCGLANLFLEMDRILRPQGWVFLRDEAALIEDARAVANQMHWESRMTQVPGDKKQRLLVCQKTFWKA